jgi:hypothetical protein
MRDEGLPGDVKRLLLAEQDAMPSESVAARMEEQIARRLREEPAPRERRSWRLQRRSLLALIPGWAVPVAAFALGSSATIGITSAVHEIGRHAPRRAASQAPATPVAPSPVEPPAAVEGSPPPPAPLVLPPGGLDGGILAPPASRRAVASQSQGPPMRDNLDRERALIDRARTALYRGADETALRYLDECAKEFPAGQLVEEREALWIQSAAGAGKYWLARERGLAFSKRYPHSLLLPAIEEVLRGTSE